MENVYWWNGANMREMENGRFILSNPELEAKIGKVTFSKPQFAESWDQSFGWLARGEKGGVTIVYQTPWNCGQLTMCGLGASKEAAVLQDFITMNIARANGYAVVTASAGKGVVKNFLDLGWHDCGNYPGRFSGPQSYIIKPVPGHVNNSMYNGARENGFTPKQLITA